MSITLNALVGRSIVPVIVEETSLVNRIFSAVSDEAPQDMRPLLKLVRAVDCQIKRLKQPVAIVQSEDGELSEEVLRQCRESSNREMMAKHISIKKYFNSSLNEEYIHIVLETPTKILMTIQLNILICGVLVSLRIENSNFVYQLCDDSRKLFPDVLDKIKNAQLSSFECKKLASPVPFRLKPQSSFLVTEETIEQCSIAEGVYMETNGLIENYFPLQPDPNQGHIHAIVTLYDERLQNAKRKLEDRNLILYRLLQVRRTRRNKWSENDYVGSLLASNSDIPHGITDIQNRLKQKRSICHDAYADVARQKFEELFNNIFDYSEQNQDNNAMEVEGPMSCGIDDTENKNENEIEILTFSILKAAFLRKFRRFVGPNSSSFLKQAAFIYNLVLFPALAYEKRGRIEFTTEQQSKIVYYLDVGETHEILGSYTPKSDFAIIAKPHGCPFLLGEVDSNTGQIDKCRMLAVAISAARVGQYLLKAGTTKLFVLMAIFLTRKLVVERYMISQRSINDNHVVIIKEEFDLGNESHAFEFLKQMYNFGKFVNEMGDELDEAKNRALAEMKDAGSDMPAYSSTAKRQGSGSKRMRNTPMEQVPEGDERAGGIGSEAAHQESGGGGGGGHDNDVNYQTLWAREDIRELLERIGCDMSEKVDITGHPRVIFLPVNDEESVFIKYVHHKDIQELKILQFLRKFDPSFKYLVPFESWIIDGGVLIKFPDVGAPVTDANNLDSRLVSIALQLFESVAFLHSHNVVHLDIKPSNVRIDDHGRLRVIDYSLAYQMESEDGMYNDFIGTKGRVAPEVEVGTEWYSLVRADRWAVGSIVREVCDRCVPSLNRDFVMDLSSQLMDTNPFSRPSMQEAVGRLLDFQGKLQNTEAGPLAEIINATYGSNLIRVH